MWSPNSDLRFYELQTDPLGRQAIASDFGNLLRDARDHLGMRQQLSTNGPIVTPLQGMTAKMPRHILKSYDPYLGGLPYGKIEEA